MQNPAVATTYLTVSFKDKDAAKALGARWDGVQRQWYQEEKATVWRARTFRPL